MLFYMIFYTENQIKGFIFKQRAHHNTHAYKRENMIYININYNMCTCMRRYEFKQETNIWLNLKEIKFLVFQKYPTWDKNSSHIVLSLYIKLMPILIFAILKMSLFNADFIHYIRSIWLCIVWRRALKETGIDFTFYHIRTDPTIRYQIWSIRSIALNIYKEWAMPNLKA